MQLAADCLMGGSCDHEIDFLQYDEDEKSLIIAQGYLLGESNSWLNLIKQLPLT